MFGLPKLILKNDAKALKKFLIEKFSLDRNVFLTIISS